MNQKKYFKKKLDSVQYSIWDLEFKRFKTAEIREEIRVEYDVLLSKIDMINAQIKADDARSKEGKLSKDERARLDDQITVLTRDSERLKQQMANLDIEINGSKPTNEYPDGASGMVQQLEALHELVGMIKQYIKQL